GYEWKGREGKHRRAPNAYEQAVMAKIHEWRFSGYSFYQIAAHLLRHGVPTADGREWSPSRVRRAWLAALRQRAGPTEPHGQPHLRDKPSRQTSPPPPAP